MRTLGIVLSCYVVLGVFVGSVCGEGGQVTCTGEVVGEDGAGIGGAKVTLYNVTVSDLTSISASAAGETVSEGDGSFVLRADSASSPMTHMSTILVEKQGLSLGWAVWKRSGDGDVKIALSEPVTLGGRIVDGEGNGIADADISISFLVIGAIQDEQFVIGDVSKKLFSTQSDGQGGFSFGRLPLGASAELVVKKADFTYCPFRPTGLALTMASIIALRLSISLSSSKLTLPRGRCIMAVLSSLNSTRPLRASSITRGRSPSGTTVPALGLGIRPFLPKIFPSLPTLPIMSGVAIEVSNSSQPPSIFLTSSSPPT